MSSPIPFLCFHSGPELFCKGLGHSAVFVCSRRWRGTPSFSYLCLQQKVAWWAGKRWADGGTTCQTALAAESSESAFLSVCSESREHHRPRWQLLEKSPDASWCISHPEVPGHYGSCPAPKCTCDLLLRMQEGSHTAGASSGSAVLTGWYL